MRDHIKNPYPTTEEVNSVAQKTNMTTTQVKDWFCNYRRRKLEGQYIKQKMRRK